MTSKTGQRFELQMLALPAGSPDREWARVEFDELADEVFDLIETINSKDNSWESTMQSLHKLLGVKVHE